jgi:hypothetical protein
MPPIYSADKCIQQEVGEPQGVGCAPLRALQFRPRASDAQDDTGDGRLRDGSAMVPVEELIAEALEGSNVHLARVS